MSDTSPASFDDAYASLIAACDDALAAQTRTKITDDAPIAPELRSQVEDALDCIRMLRQHWPQPGDNSEITPGAMPTIGRFIIRRELGYGSFGRVYLAYDPALAREVALKVPRFDAHTSPELRARFRREAQAAASLDHPHIVQVFEAGETGSVCYIASAFCSGPTLAAWMKQQTEPVPFRLAAQIVADLADAVEHAHQHGVLHRDLKPGNVLLQKDEGGRMKDESVAEGGSSRFILHPSSFILPKITDFGLAKIVAGSSDGAAGPGYETESGAMLGTPQYMAPEQAGGPKEQVQAPADTYALGAILYELLTGRPPFQADSVMELLFLVRSVEPVSLHRLRHGTPADLETICLKCLQKEPAKRYGSARELADDLRRFLNGEPIQARPVGAFERASRWCQRNPRWAAMLGAMAGLLVIIAAGGWGLSAWAWREETKSREKLFESKLSDARSTSLSRRPGQRFKSLALLDEARSLALSLNLPAEEFHELRNATIAALAMPDLYPVQEWDGFPPGSTGVDFDGNLGSYARTDTQGNCSIRRVDGDVELYHVPGPASGPTSHFPCLTRDGRFVLICSQPGPSQGGLARIWRLDQLEPELVLTETDVVGYDLHSNSREAAFVSSSGEISHYDLNTGRPLHRPLPPDTLKKEAVIALHPTEPLVAVASYYASVAQIRDLRSGAVVKSLDMPKASSHVAWHPQGHTLAISEGDGGYIHLFDRQTLERLRKFGSAGGGARIHFNHAGDRIATTSWAGGVALWDVATGLDLMSIPYAITSRHLRFSRDDGRLSSFVEGNRLGIWRVADGKECRALVRQLTSGKVIGAVSISPDGKLLAAATTDGVGFWDVDSGTSCAFTPLEKPTSVHFEPHGTLLIGDPSGTYRWPIRSDSISPSRIRIGPPQSTALPPAFCNTQSHDGRVQGVAMRAVGHTEPWAGAWLLHADNPAAPLHFLPGKDVWHVALSPDGRWLITRQLVSGPCRLWDVRTGRHERLLVESGGEPRFSPDGRWLYLGGDVGQLFDTQSWQEVRKLENRGNFSGDSQLLAMHTHTSAVRLVEVATGRELCRLEDPSGDTLSTVLFAPGDRRLVTINVVKGIRVWDLPLIRQQLKERDLDWGAPPYDAAPLSTQHSPLQVQFDLGDFDQLRKTTRAKNLDSAVQTAPDLPIRWRARRNSMKRKGATRKPSQICARR